MFLVTYVDVDEVSVESTLVHREDLASITAIFSETFRIVAVEEVQ